MQLEVWGNLPMDVLWCILEKLPILILARLAIKSRNCKTIYTAKLRERRITLRACLHWGEPVYRRVLKGIALTAIQRFLTRRNVFNGRASRGLLASTLGFYYQVPCRRMWAREEYGRRVLIEVKQDVGNAVIQGDFLTILAFLDLTFNFFWRTGLAMYLLPTRSPFAFVLLWNIVRQMLAVAAVAVIVTIRFGLRWRSSQRVQQELVIRAKGVRISVLAEWSLIRRRDNGFRRGRLQNCTALLDAGTHADALWMLALLLQVSDDYESQYSRCLLKPKWMLHSQSFTAPQELLRDVPGPLYQRRVLRRILLPVLWNWWAKLCTPWVEPEALHLVSATWKPRECKAARWKSYFLDWRFS